MALVDRVKRILLTPKPEWEVINTEPATTGSIYTGYVIPLAAVPAIAAFIGLSLIGISVLGSSFRIPIGTGLTYAVVQYASSLVATFLLALVIDALAPTFGAQKNQIQALKGAAYSLTPFWVAGILSIIPSLGNAVIPGFGIFALLGLIYGLYLLYLGLPILMKAPTDKVPGYTLVVGIAAVVIFYLVGYIATRVTYGGWGGGMPNLFTP